MSKSEFMRIAAQAGIEVEFTPGRKRHPRTGEPVSYELMLDHPTMVFSGSQCHSDGSLMGGEGEVTPDWKILEGQLRRIVSEGLTPCEDPDCSWCEKV